jgi:CDP-6-deoxy-D-xylo-4-hexulose-3-dehydrase
VPYGLSVHDGREAAAVSAVIGEHRTALGRETRAFEEKVARLFGKKYGVMVNSGSSANLLALEILDLPAGSEVITPALTFNTTVAPILQKDLKPVFVDVEPDTYLIRVDEIESHITAKTRVLMIPSLIGNVPDLARLRRIARKHELTLVEDSCDTLGATFRDRPTGSFTHISTTSFYGSHVINAAGGGGMICVNSRRLRDRLRVLRGWGRTSSLFADSEDVGKRFRRKLDGIPYDGKFLFTEQGYNFLPLEISAAFGLVQLRKLRGFTSTRRKNFARLQRTFARHDAFFSAPRQLPAVKTNWLAFPLTIREDASFSRLELVRFLEGRNIQTRPVFTGNVLRQPAYRAMQNGQLFPAADRIMRDAFLIGCHQGLNSTQLNHLEATFEEFLERRGHRGPS